MKTPLWLKKLLLVLAILATAEWLYILVLKLFASHLSPHGAVELALVTPLPILVLSILIVLRLKPIIWMLLFAVMITPTEAGSFWLMTPDGYGFPAQSTNEVWVYPDASTVYQVDLTNLDKGGNLYMLRWDNYAISNFFSPSDTSQAWNVFARTNDSAAWAQTYFCQTGWVSFNTSLNGPLGSPWSSNCVWINYDQWGNAIATNHGKAVMDVSQNMTLEDSNGVPVWGNVTKGWGPLFYPAGTSGKFRLGSPAPPGVIPMVQMNGEQWIQLTNGDVIVIGGGIQPQSVLLAGCCVAMVILVCVVGGCVIKKIAYPICKNIQKSQATNNPAPPDD